MCLTKCGSPHENCCLKCSKFLDKSLNSVCFKDANPCSSCQSQNTCFAQFMPEKKPESKPIDSIDLSKYETAVNRHCADCAMYTLGCGRNVPAKEFGCTLKPGYAYVEKKKPESKPIDSIDLSKYDVVSGFCPTCAMYTLRCGPGISPSEFGCTLDPARIYAEKKKPESKPIDSIDLSKHDVVRSSSIFDCAERDLNNVECSNHTPDSFGCPLPVGECYKKKTKNSEEDFILAETIPDRTHFLGVLFDNCGLVSGNVPKLFVIWGDSVVPVETKEMFGAPKKFGVKVFNYRAVSIEIKVTPIFE